ncbi:kelch-like protein 22 [Rhincodon typus]|uniref:kelch-like protein 22 n=1 Tax=Rhincodon typus TaxID=259920 RepID=UPI00202DCAAC|nr:kelch-like protein 22 [Rhincodon typus]
MTMAEEGKDKQQSQKKVSQTYQSSAHSQSLLDGLVALRNSASLFDVTLIVEGKSIEAHRILLAASCDYFRGMFAGGLREMQEKEIFLHDITYMAMCKILDFIYTSEMELNLNNVQDVLVAACQLQGTKGGALETVDELVVVLKFCKFVYAHAGAVHAGKIYVACGRSGRSYLKELNCYDPEANQWEMKASAPVERAWHGMAAVRGQLYLLGGSNNANGYRQDVVQVSCYSPERDQWSTVSEMPFGHGEPGIAVLDDRIYILGGRSHDRYTRTDYVHIYNVAEHCWEQAPDIECANSGMSCCVLTLPRQLVEDWGSPTPRKHSERACRRAYMLPEVVGLSDFEEFSSSED